jgi:AraC-like DNA-binding protein
MHLTLEPGNSEIHGVYLRRFSRIIEGSGRVLGVKFRPGGFRPFAKRSISDFTGKILPPSEVFGSAIRRLENDATACAEAVSAFEYVDTFLRRFDVTPSSEQVALNHIVQAIISDQSITRVEVLVQRFGLGIRQLQRMFRDYVGLSPKSVIQRYRLIEAVERIRRQEKTTDFASLAIDLGYADQAHFIRDFKKLVGKPPPEYQKEILVRTTD